MTNPSHTDKGATKRPAHRPVTIDARRVNVTLDEATIERAREIGGGNVSEGIRRAVALVDQISPETTAKNPDGRPA
jgi:hypothetical protein